MTVTAKLQFWMLAHDFDLMCDLTTYYAVCCLVGLIEGLYIGNQIARLVL